MKKKLIFVIPILIIFSIIAVFLLINNDYETQYNNNVQEEINISVEDFNKQFDGYGGTDADIEKVKELFNIIENSNEQYLKYQIQVDEAGITNISELQENRKYLVQFYSNEEKYINKVKISEQFTIILNRSE